MASRTTSLRIDPLLSERLEKVSRHLGRSRNWIINRAIEEYLEAAYPEAFVQEARRQSRLVGEREGQDAGVWAGVADTSGWR